MNYKEIQCKTACNKLKRNIPYSWDLNIYRGCEHSCQYCYALYSHTYLDDEEFFRDIYVKANIVEVLEKQLSSSTWKREVVNLGGVTDSYQNAEAVYQLMPEILKLFIKYQTPCIISTKSDLILRDYDLIDELSHITYVNVALTITTMDETIRKKIEPGGADSLKRFAMLKEFSNTNASTGLHVMPIIPFLTDTHKNIESLYSCAHDSKVSYVLPGTLYLKGKTRNVFFEFVQKEYPHIYKQLKDLYHTGGAPREYKNELYKMVNDIRKKYGLSSSYRSSMKEKMKQEEYTQLSLFD